MTDANQDSSTGQSEAQEDWRVASAGWRRSIDVIEAEEGGKRFSAKLVQLARIDRGDAVLDVAGGYGEPSLTAARAVGPGGRVVCNDISGDMLAFGQERAATAGLENVEFVECDAEQLDFESGSFDAVVSRAGLMFLPDVAGTLMRLHSFLKPGGRLAAARQRRDGLLERLRLAPSRVIARRADRPAELARAVAHGAGVRVERAAERLAALERLGRELSPERVLERGYSITRDERGAVLRRPEAVASGSRIITTLAGGELTSRVETA